MHQLRRPAVVALVAAALIACGDSSGPAPAHVGTYTLRTVQSKPLPVTLNGMGLQVFAGAIVLRENGTYTRTWETEFSTGPGSQPIPNPKVQCSGTYTVDGAYVKMTETTAAEGCRSYDAGFKTDTLMHVQGDTLFGVYVK